MTRAEIGGRSDRIPSESLDMGPVVGVRAWRRARETEFTDGSASTD